MIVEYTRYQIAEERRAAFVEAYTKAAEFLKASPACVAYELTQCQEDPQFFILRIEWKSAEEHLQGFRKEPGFQEFFQLVKPYFRDIQEMNHYELTGVVHRR